MRQGTSHIHESELKILALLWQNGEMSAGNIATSIMESYGWKRNTTYTVITKLINKGIIERHDPGYLCKALVTRDEVIVSETKSLLEKVYEGSLSMLVTAFLKKHEVSDKELKALRELLNKEITCTKIKEEK
ncbi:MAG: BlaI/MecI/CopY family transcriptional regulator [Bacillaceae bacterium]